MKLAAVIIETKTDSNYSNVPKTKARFKSMYLAQEKIWCGI